MFCLYNGEYGEHDLSHVCGIEKTLIRQKEHYKDYIGTVVGDFTVLNVEYDWGKRTQRWEVECNFCHKREYLYNAGDWRRGKGRSTRCKCHKIRDNLDKLLESSEKPKKVLNDDPSWVDKEINGWRIMKYAGDGYFLVECVDCGKQKKVSSGQIKRESVVQCNHIIPNDYSRKEWIGKKNGHLTAVSYIGKYFEAVCDCGKKVTVRATDLFTYKTATTCKDDDCPYYHEQLIHNDGLKRQKSGLAYEHSAAKLFEDNGYIVERTSDIGDFGVDFIVHLTDDEHLAIQCKKQKTPASVSAIQEVYAGGRYHNCNRFAVISPSGFSSNAIQMAAKLGVYCAVHKFCIEEVYNASYHALSLLEVLPKIDTKSRKHRMERQFTIDGVTKYLSEWCDEYNVKPSTVDSKLRAGYNFKDAISLCNGKRQTYTVNGITGTLAELARHYGVIAQTVQYRIRQRGMSIEEALLTPTK